MTSAEITRELRAARPVAPDGLRERVLAGAARGPVPAPSLRERLGGWARRPLVALPVAAALLVAVTVGVAVSRPASEQRESVERAAVGGGATPTEGGAAAQDLVAPSSKAAPPGARAQRISAWLSLRVADGEALAEATADALRIVRSLDGYVVRSDVTAGDEGGASLSVRVPAAASQDAVARLSALGTIVGQRVVADDLQGDLDALDDELARLRARLASVQAQLATGDLTPAERAALRARRDVLAARLAEARTQRGALAAEAAEATIDLELRTEQATGLVPPPSRFDRTLGRALDLLAWEALVVAGVLVVLAPVALLAALGLVVLRRQRRRGDDRALGLA